MSTEPSALLTLTGKPSVGLTPPCLHGKTVAVVVEVCLALTCSAYGRQLYAASGQVKDNGVFLWWFCVIPVSGGYVPRLSLPGIIPGWSAGVVYKQISFPGTRFDYAKTGVYSSILIFVDMGSAKWFTRFPNFTVGPRRSLDGGTLVAKEIG